MDKDVNIKIFLVILIPDVKFLYIMNRYHPRIQTRTIISLYLQHHLILTLSTGLNSHHDSMVISVSYFMIMDVNSIIYLVFCLVMSLCVYVGNV